VLPAALAVAEQKPVSGQELMTAYHVGVEVECKIAEAISPRHYEDGFHSTGTIGPLGAAAACARLRGYSVEQTQRTLGIAASEGAGLREQFGTMTKPFHAGHAAESGVFAADLAQLGWTAAPQILEAPRGFFHAYGGTYEPSFIQDRLGKPWTLASPGVSIKPYPSGSLTHPGMTEMLRLIQANHIQGGQVEKVDVGTNHNMPNALIHHHPTTGLQAKFSMEYCLAILLLYGNAGLRDFTDAAVNRPEAQAMLRRVNFYVDPEAERAGYDKMTTILHIHLKDGKVISGRADFAKGSPANPMSYEEVATKFRGNAAFAQWPTTKADAMVEAVRHLENLDNIGKLLALWGKQE
jgi:2-methylcitrate dehydratase PrpD